MMRVAWQIGIFYSKKYHKPRDFMISQAMYGLVEGVSRCGDRPVEYILAYIHGYCKQKFFWKHEHIEDHDKQVQSATEYGLDLKDALAKLNVKQLNVVSALLDNEGSLDAAAKQLGITRMTLWRHRQAIINILTET
jgi:DNA-directed RNA polymerase specialized sigma subunit